MKKLSAILLSAAMLVSAASLTACGQSPEEKLVNEIKSEAQSYVDSAAQKIETKQEKFQFLEDQYKEQMTSLYDSYKNAATYEDTIKYAEEYNAVVDQLIASAEELDYTLVSNFKYCETINKREYMTKALYLKYNSDNKYKYFTAYTDYYLDDRKDDVIMVFYNNSEESYSNNVTDILFAFSDGRECTLDFTKHYRSTGNPVFTPIEKVTPSKLLVKADQLVYRFDISGKEAVLEATSDEEGFFDDEYYDIDKTAYSSEVECVEAGNGMEKIEKYVSRLNNNRKFFTSK